MDVEFFVYQQRILGEQELEAQRTLTVSLAKYDDLKDESDKLWLRVYETQSRFWAEMAQPHPSLGKLGDLGLLLEQHTAACAANFEQQLTLCPQSVQSMRRYAQFLSEVCAAACILSCCGHPDDYDVVVCACARQPM